MTRVLLLATTTGYQTRSFGDAAEELGIRLVLASDRCDHLDDPWRDGAIPVRFHDPAGSVDAIRDTFQDAPPAGILAVGDRPAILAAHVAQAFARPGNPVSAATASRNKRLTRELLSAAGMRAPAFRAVHLSDDPARLASSVRFPAVIKPLALSGSRGVMRVDNEREFVTAFTRLRRLLASVDVRIERDEVHDEALIEEFVPGSEYAVEGVLTNGGFHAFAIFDKPDPLNGPFFEETIYVTPSRASGNLQRDVIAAVGAAARALGLQHGPVHAECRVNDRGVYVLEVAARPIGGLCAKALRFAGRGDQTASLEELLLRHAIGEDIAGYVREPHASGVMMIPIPRRGIYRGVEGVDEARAVPGIDEVRMTAKPDALIVPLPEGRSYLGFIFARGQEPASVEAALRTAHAHLRFDIERELALATPDA